MKMNFTIWRIFRFFIDAVKNLSQSTKNNYAETREQREHESRDNRTRIPSGIPGLCLQGDRRSL
ncbi:hypothetical protein DA102_022300 [Sinorhizobium meliloti]|nr:hypothetical protein CDO24_21020 [Sinorhizobium meliloti]ATA96854.1 hypothetical protein BWO76_10990 [Sinorhizobium meliloti]RMI18322.1 hypothetical protein DA102_022300 [Sinorhizobium meliloti]